MHVYHPKKIVQEMPPSFVDQQPMDHGMWMPSGAIPSAMIPSPSSASSSAMAAAAAASLSSMVQDKLSTQLAQELMMRYRNLDAPSVGGTTDGDASDYLRDYYRQQRKLSDQLMLQEAMQLPNFAQTKYLSNMGYNWDKSFGVKSSDECSLDCKCINMKQFLTIALLLLIVLCSVLVSVESAIAGDRLVFHVPINYKNVHMTKTRVKPIHHRTIQKTDYKLLGYSMDKHAHGAMEQHMSPMEYLAKMQILRG
uniref:Uncharacterized protein n=1 Tax=Anopheles minimus TaxID=112268 RepID=A0A182VXI6_9DIPT